MSPVSMRGTKEGPSLSSLPPEMLSSIGTFLPTKTLYGFRQQCRKFEKATFNEFARRGYAKLMIDPKQQPKRIVGLLQTFDQSPQLASYVEHLTIVGNISSSRSDQEAATLVSRLLCRLPKLTSLEIRGVSQSRTTSLTFLQVAGKPLTQLILSCLTLELADLIDLIDAVAPSLEQLELRGVGTPTRNDWKRIFQHISETCHHLKKLDIAGDFHKEDSGVPGAQTFPNTSAFMERVRTKPHNWIRGDNGRLEQWSIAAGYVWMHGSQAVRVGLLELVKLLEV